MTVEEMIREDMKRAEDEMRRLLAVEMFTGLPAFPPRPTTWRNRIGVRLWPIRSYMTTLWKALRGVELTEPYED